MGLTHLVRRDPGRHRFDTLPFPVEQQAGAISLQRKGAIGMPRGLRQAIEIGREAFRLGAWRHRVGAHEQQLSTESLRGGWVSQQEESSL